MHKPMKPDASRVVFRDVRDEDLPLLFALRRDAALQSLLLTVPDGLDDASLRAWVARRQQDPGGMFCVIEEVSTGEVIGYAQVSQVHRRNRSGYPGIALAEQARGRGLGQATLRRLIDTSRDELGLFKLTPEVRIDNYAAIRYHLILGARVVGTLQAHFADPEGSRHDVLLLEHLLDDS